MENIGYNTWVSGALHGPGYWAQAPSAASTSCPAAA